MSSLTGRGDGGPAALWGAEVQHHSDPVRFSATTNGADSQTRRRPAPEGSRGSRGDPRRIMCQRADAVPSYRSLPGTVGDRIRSAMSSGGGTTWRGAGSAGPPFGRSDGKVACCEKCSATLVALKKQALSLAVHHHFSCKESGDLPAFLHANLRVHSRASDESRDREQGAECGACGVNLNQLKREAVHLALCRGQTLTKPPFEPSEVKHGDRPPHGPQSPQRTPQTLRRRGPKLPNPDMGRWVEEQQQLVASKCASAADGVIMYPYQKAADETAGRDAGAVQTSSKIPHISRVVTIANTAAMSFLARAAEKLNLTSRKKGQASDPAPAHFTTCFRELIQKSPPPAPSWLLQAATRTKDSPAVGKVNVVLRVNPAGPGGPGGPGGPPALWIDPSKRRVTIVEALGRNQTTMTLGRQTRDLLKTFSFDTAFPQESSQAELSAGVLGDVIRCVLGGSDGCVLALGCADVGSWSSMVGSGESLQKLGLLPCAISWLYSAIERRREKTWTDLTVSVSAIELCCGEEDTLRDLLGEVVPPLGSVQDSPKAHIRLHEDPVSGIQLRNHNRVKAPTAERAASLLDAAIAARRHNDFITYLSHCSVMFFTLHIQPPRTDNSTVGKGSRGGATKLTMIDVCGGMRPMSRIRPPYSELGPAILSLLSGHKTGPSKGSKLTMLLREALGHVTCHTTVVAQVDDSLAHLQDSLSTIQLASSIRRTQKRTKQSASCSPCGRSLTREKRGPPSLSLRAFHSTDEVDVDAPRFRLRGELDERSSSEQSCDTVIQIDSEGLVHSKGPSRLAQPEFVPIIPSLHPNKADMDDPEFTALLQELLRIPQLQAERQSQETLQGNAEALKADAKQPGRDCLKCDTFAELQERLGCIDGREATMEGLKSSSKGPSINNVTVKPQPQNDAGKQTDTEPSQTLLSVGEKPADAAFPGDSFQREDSGLYDCEECSGTSSSEELLNQTLSRCRSITPKHVNLKSEDQPSHDAAVTGATPQPPPQESPETADWFKPDKRTSPVGKSSPISPPSSSCSSSRSLPTSVVLGDALARRPAEDVKELKATITVTVQQPLDLKGQDELVFSMVEEVTIRGALDRGRAGGNIICIRDPAESQARVQGFASSQPIRIISNVSDETAAVGSLNTNNSSVAQERPIRRENRFLPSFINPMLIDTDVARESEDKATPRDTEVKSQCELRGSDVRCPEDRKSLHKRSVETQARKSERVSDSAFTQRSPDPMLLEDSAFCDEAAGNKACGKRARHSDQRRDGERVYAAGAPKGSDGGEVSSRRVGNAPQRFGVSPGCHETTVAAFSTGSLPRGWQDAKHQDSLWHHLADRQRDPRGMTSSTPCSPGGTLERRRGRQHSLANASLHVSTPRRPEPPRKGAESLFETSGLRVKPDAPLEDSSRLFTARLEQLVTRTNSLDRTPRAFPGLHRGSSSTSVSSKGSTEACMGGYRGTHEGDSTLPRANRSPRKTPRSEHFLYSEKSTRHAKLSAVGKLKMTSPKVRRLSVPGTKNLPPHRGLQQSINRSASLSPDSKTVSFERSSSFLSSSPPRSFPSVGRTLSQSSTCSSTKSALQGFVNGRISDFFRERPSSPTSAGPDQMSPLPSPYSRVTAPRTPDHLSGHASDTTSVLSGDLPPAMGKTSLNLSNRTSVVSSGYDSMMRDSEQAGSAAASTRNSVSDQSSSALSVARSSRSSRRRGSAGTNQRRLTHDAPLTLRRSASGLRSGWADRGVPDAYKIKVYEIDNVQKMQKRAGAGKQGTPCFSAKLRFLELRQRRISAVRAKYSDLRGELERAKQDLMLEPSKWNQEFDLWQTFEVDSLEHLEALEVVTARLENRLHLCKASVMMVTCFDAGGARRRHKKRRRELQRGSRTAARSRSAHSTSCH